MGQIVTAGEPSEKPSEAIAAEPKPSESGAWLRDNAILQPLNGTVFGTLLVAWVAIGASGSMAIAGGFALSIAIPILGWFIGLPIMVGVALFAGMLWVMGVFGIFAAWAVTAATVAFVTFAKRSLNNR